MTINAMELTVSQALDMLLTAWELQREHGMAYSYMFHGPSGVGKTQMIEQFARMIGAKLYTMTMSSTEVEDIRGLAYYDHETGKTRYYRPEDLPDDEGPAILFIDEVTATPPHLIAPIYGLLQERKAASHKLNKNTMVITAGNRVEDGAQAFDMNTALSDRLVQNIIICEAEDWLANFAMPKGLHPAVITNIKMNPGKLHTVAECIKAQKTIACTPRSHERASNFLWHVKDPVKLEYFLSGALGVAEARSLLDIAAENASSATVLDLLQVETEAERVPLYPTTRSGLIYMMSGIHSVVKEETLWRVFDIVGEVRNLAELRPGEGFEALPLSEFQVLAMNMIYSTINRIDARLFEAATKHPVVIAYNAEREALGLSSY